MKKFYLLFLLMGFSLCGFAQSYDYLTLRTADGTEKSIGIDGLRITFADGKLLAANGKEETQIALADMACMFFATAPTAIESLTAADAAGLRVQISGGRLLTNAPAGSDIRVYSLDGRLAPTQGLSSGAYLVRVNGRTFKVVAQ